MFLGILLGHGPRNVDVIEDDGDETNHAQHPDRAAMSCMGIIPGGGCAPTARGHMIDLLRHRDPTTHAPVYV